MEPDAESCSVKVMAQYLWINPPPCIKYLRVCARIARGELTSILAQADQSDNIMI
jgi:hypothetical protein